jgi:hypothetical protein
MKKLIILTSVCMGAVAVIFFSAILIWRHKCDAKLLRDIGAKDPSSQFRFGKCKKDSIFRFINSRVQSEDYPYYIVKIESDDGSNWYEYGFYYLKKDGLWSPMLVYFDR